MITHHTPKTACPHCHRPNDFSSGLSDRPPEEGALALCISCGGFARFNADGSLRAAEVHEDDISIEQRAHIRRLIDHIKARGPISE